MPALAERHTVYAVDLPGLGDGTGSPTGYDKATLARYVHSLIADRLGVRDARVVGYDFGAAVAFHYAAQFPADTARLGYLDLPLPGPKINASAYRSLSWHIAFHSQRRVPEALSGGFALYRALDKDVHAARAATPVRVPTLLLTARGQLDAIRATVAPRMSNIVRAADVPNAGHWLVEENPRFVTGELLRFLDD